MRRSATATAVQLAGVDAETKLALLEFLLSQHRPAGIRSPRGRLAGRAHSASAQAVVVISEPGSDLLHLIAEHGVSSSAVADFALTRDDEGHPLIRAMDRRQATYFTGSHQFRAPIEGRPFHAIPLRDDDSSAPRHGLLLASTTSPELHPEVAWLGRILGRQVSRLLSRHTLAETRFGQERMLLYSIINAVTDPILLTDTEGKLIIANSHAEKLFAAPEDESEGRRRATGLNNMLFSAALSTSAVEPDGTGAPRAAAGGSARGIRPAVRASQLARDRRAAGHLRRVDPAQRHRPAPRERRDRGELPHASRWRRRKCAPSATGWISSSTRSPIRSWSPTQEGDIVADERAGRAALHGDGVGARLGAAARAGQRCALLRPSSRTC